MIYSSNSLCCMCASIVIIGIHTEPGPFSLKPHRSPTSVHAVCWLCNQTLPAACGHFCHIRRLIYKMYLICITGRCYMRFNTDLIFDSRFVIPLPQLVLGQPFPSVSYMCPGWLDWNCIERPAMKSRCKSTHVASPNAGGVYRNMLALIAGNEHSHLTLDLIEQTKWGKKKETVIDYGYESCPLILPV